MIDTGETLVENNMSFFALLSSKILVVDLAFVLAGSLMSSNEVARLKIWYEVNA